MTARIKTPWEVMAKVVQSAYGPEAGASAHATISRVLDDRDKYTVDDILDLMHAAIVADRAQFHPPCTGCGEHSPDGSRQRSSGRGARHLP